MLDLGTGRPILNEQSLNQERLREWLESISEVARDSSLKCSKSRRREKTRTGKTRYRNYG
ncbi:hypothetical protein [Archaeoglobus sulfaticallidus]|uniref:hypothetical protein n=1 Tax=Archaeoglobus sulfaticallidus TaxID=1316941 RepID=UPI00064E7426|nr:hypothetical protein [Archaeoglobus sulfaticallidus]